MTDASVLSARIKRIIKSLHTTALIVVLAFVALMVWANNDRDMPFILLIFMAGALGAVMREYVMLKAISTASMENASKPTPILFIYLSPLVGGVLATVLMLIFMSGLIEGDLFPQFLKLDESFQGLHYLSRNISLATQQDALKLIIWSVIAGYTENLVTNFLNKSALRTGGK